MANHALNRFRSGPPCRKCGGTRYYSKNGSCVICVRRRAAEAAAKTARGNKDGTHDGLYFEKWSTRTWHRPAKGPNLYRPIWAADEVPAPPTQAGTPARSSLRTQKKCASPIRTYAEELLMVVVHVKDDGLKIGMSYADILAKVKERYPTVPTPGPHFGKPPKITVKELQFITSRLRERGIFPPHRPRPGIAPELAFATRESRVRGILRVSDMGDEVHTV